MSVLHKVQRALCAVIACWLGAFALATILVPKYIATKAIGVAAPSALAAFAQLGAGTRLGLAIVAMVAAFMPRPARPLVSAIALGMFLGVVGVLFNRALGIYTPAEAKPFALWLWVDGLLAVSLGVSEILRYILRRA
jgi:hypothetical protein